MNQNVKDYVSEKVKEMISAHSCCKELKEAIQTQNLIAEIEMDIVTADGLYVFASSEAGSKVFGAEMAKNVAAHAQELKASGVKYCDCPACAAAEAILAKKEELL